MISTSPTHIRPEPQLNGAKARFGNAALKQGGEAVAKELYGEIRNLKNAERIYNKMGKKLSKFNARLFNLSLEDWAGRFLTIFGVYLPQAYYSMKENKHKVETNARNALVWTMTLAIYILMKNENVGVNSIFNQFMKPKVGEAEVSGFMKKQINKMRLEHNYFELLDEAGIKYSADDAKKMFWTKLDKNHTDKLAHRVEDIAQELTEKLKPHEMDLKKLEHLVKSNAIEETNTELMKLGKQFSKMKSIRKFLMRQGAFSIINTVAITGAIIYLVGGLAMKIVLNTVAPLDHDFVPSKDQNLDNPIYKWVMKRREEKKGLESPDYLRNMPVPETFNTPYPQQGYPTPNLPPVNQLVSKLTPQQQLQFKQALLKFQAQNQQPQPITESTPQGGQQ